MRRHAKTIILLLSLLFIALSFLGCASTLQQRTLDTPSADSKYEPPESDKMVKVMEEIQHRLEAEHQVTIEDLDETEMIIKSGGKAWGATDVEHRHILLLAGIPPDARFETLLHEAAHIFHPTGLERSAREVFAEEVMVRVSRYYGWDASDRSRQYLAQWKGGYAALPFVQLELNEAVRALTGQRR